MASFQKIAVMGKGRLGSAMVEELTKAGFAVTVFTRKAGTVGGLPAGVSVAEVDYSSTDSLATALQGHDVAISTVGFDALAGQKPAIDGCIRAGVRRYIPCDWTTLSTDPRAQEAIPTLAALVEVQRYLADEAASAGLEHTIFSVGTFMETVLGSPLLINFASRAVTLYDNGKHAFSVTSVTSIAKAVAVALKSAPEATRNRNLFVHDATVSQAQLLALAKKHTPGETWATTSVDAKTQFDTLRASLISDGPAADMSNVFGLLAASLCSGMFNSAYKSPDNELLGLGFVTEAELESKIAALYK